MARYRIRMVGILLTLMIGAVMSYAAATHHDGGSAEAEWKRLPMQVWPVLGSHAEGLLITSDPSDSMSPWGTLLIWDKILLAGSAKQTAPAAQSPYWFFTGGHSAQVVYFRSAGEGINYLNNWSVPVKDGGTAHYDAAMFTPLTQNRWGLHANAHLVAVEVNGGAGAPPNIHFVITDARILDGTPGYPAPMDLLTTARKEWERRLAEVDPALRVTLDKADRDAPGKAFGDEIEDAGECVYPTWLAKEHLMRVTYYHRLTRTSIKREQHMGYHPAPLGAPGVPPHMETFTYKRVYGAACALTLDLDAANHIVNEVSYGPSAITPSYDEPGKNK